MRWLEDLDNDPIGLIEDEPWCGEFEDHDCLGADCVRRPARRDVGYSGLSTCGRASTTVDDAQK